jgi:hypothetical protein
MTESQYEILAPRAGTSPADAPEQGRRPFVAPVVEEMGGLAELTLLGGTV